MSDEQRPWKVGGKYGEKFGDRWPATFVTERHGGTYQSRGGLVLHADLAEIRCGYAADGRSMDKGCEQWGGPRGECVPGCTMQTWPCDEQVDVRSSNNGCAWRADQLDLLAMQQDFMDSRYNEIVIDPQPLQRHLPHSVMAVFYSAGGGEAAQAESAAVHARYLAEYHLTSDRFPLLEYSAPPGQAPWFSCKLC